MSRRPRRRLRDRKKVLLGVGGVLLVCTFGLFLAALFQPSSSDVGLAASTSGQSTLRATLGNLFFGASAPRTIPPFAGETSQDPVARMTALVHLMESIRDESSLRELRPRILDLFGTMLQTEAKNARVAAEKRPDVAQALPQFDQRMVAASERLAVIPGGLDLRRKSVELARERPIPTPTWDGEAGSLPTIASWVVWGWTTPPPPEPPQDRRRRRRTVEASGRHPDVIRVYVHGVTSDSMVQSVTAKVREASRGMVVAPATTGEVRVFQCGKIDDFRAVTYRFDVGPMIKIEAEIATLHVQLDQSKLFTRSRESVTGPIPPLDFRAAGIPAATSVALPAPPEPDDVRRRREDFRWDAGENLEGVEVVLHGSNEALNGLAYKRLAALKLAKKLRGPSTGFLPSTIRCDDVGDMRVFARKLDLGTVIHFDDKTGVIAVVVDPARLSQPRQTVSTSP